MLAMGVMTNHFSGCRIYVVFPGAIHLVPFSMCTPASQGGKMGWLDPRRRVTSLPTCQLDYILQAHVTSHSLGSALEV